MGSQSQERGMLAGAHGPSEGSLNEKIGGGGERGGGGGGGGKRGGGGKGG